MIHNIMWILGIFLGNLVLGSIVWCSIDYPDQRLFKWMVSAPPEIDWLTAPLVLTCWPIGLYFRIKNRDKK